MAWVRVDDGFPEHPKVLDIGPVAEALWLRAMCYANRNRTDGLIPVGFVRRMSDMDGEANAKRLLEAKLWETVEGDSGVYRIHDYGSYQMTKERIESVSKVRAEAGRKGGLARNTTDEAKSKQVAKQLPKQTQAKPKPNPNPNNNPIPTQPKVVDLVAPLRDLKQEEESIPTSSGAEAPSAAAAKPFDLLEAMCDELGQDVSVLAGSEKSKQLGFAKRLVAAGLAEQDIRRMVRWLSVQTWVMSGTGVDMRLLDSQLGKWQLAGKPDGMKPSSRASPNGTHRGQRAGDLLPGLIDELRSGT